MIYIAKNRLIVVALFLFAATGNAQTPLANSLKPLIKSGKNDTAKVSMLNKLGWELMYRNPDTAIVLGKQALQLSKKLKDTFHVATSHNNLGVYHWVKGLFPEALKHHLAALALREKINDRAGQAGSLSNIGIINWNTGNTAKAKLYMHQALDIALQIDNKPAIAKNLGNIGVLYYQEGKLDSSLAYYLKALEAENGLNNQTRIANQLGNVGIVYYVLADSAKNNPVKQKNYFQKAIAYYEQALAIERQLGNTANIVRHHGNLSAAYIHLKNYKKAQAGLTEALALCDSLGLLKEKTSFEYAYSELMRLTGNFQNAVYHYTLHLNLRDSLFNLEKNDELTRSQMNYEFEKKENKIKANQLKKEAVEAADKQRQFVFLLLVAAIALGIIIVAFIVYRALRTARKQKTIIQEQKHLVDEKQKEIIDSIQYAKRIQTALLPHQKYIAKNIERLSNKTTLLVLVLISISLNLTAAGTNPLDSLKILNAKPSKNSVTALNRLCLFYEFENPPVAKTYTLAAFQMAKKLGYKKGMYMSYLYQGYLHDDAANDEQSIYFYKKALSGFKQIKDMVNTASTYEALASWYRARGQYPKAFNYLFASIKIEEKYGSAASRAASYGNLGIFYYEQQNYAKALEWYGKSLPLAKKSGKTFLVSAQLSNIGNVYSAMHRNALALKYFFESVAIDIKNNDKNGLASTYNNIGTIYEEQGDSALKAGNKKLAFEVFFKDALTYYGNALQLAQERSDFHYMAIYLRNMGSIHANLGNFTKAFDYLDQCLVLSKKMNNVFFLMDAYQVYGNIHNRIGNYEKSLAYFKLHAQYKDSVFNQDKQNEITRQGLNYAFEKKEASIRAKNERKAAVAATARKKQFLLLLLVAFIAIVIGVITVIVFRSLKSTRKQKAYIEEQKLMVEEKQKEIIDSIKYAQRIQQALLPSQKYIQKAISGFKNKG
ncbi:MAG TPA: tetratricopeptide repeat protein [Flavobacteriales bacterium]|nr:tetratricopeptide repeat protein [Flavobacteriales bacterium]